MSAGLYIHVPFCLKKCRYCDFVSYPFKEDAAAAYLRALRREMELYGQIPDVGEKEFSSVFIGGGTPTCLAAGELAAILEAAAKIFTLSPGCEITVEANPGTVCLIKLRDLAAAGFNRLSLGVQSFDDRLLRVLGRLHTAGEASGAFTMARAAGFANINIDLIFGIPGQTARESENTLCETVRMAPEHIAAYSLQVEEGTPLAQSIERGEIAPCPEELDLAMYRGAIDNLKSAGYSHYEISNFARPGRESRHNLGYWRNRPYLGLGPAAHSYLGGCRFFNEPSLESYIDRLSRGELPLAGREELSPETEMSETMFTGLRLTGGVDLAGFHRRFGRPAQAVYREQIKKLAGMGLVEQAGGFLRLTGRGLPLANEVFKEFI